MHVDHHPYTGDCLCSRDPAFSPEKGEVPQACGFGRRAVWFGLVAPRLAGAAGHAEALLLSCIDYRLTDKIAAYIHGRLGSDKGCLAGDHSHRSPIAGAGWRKSLAKFDAHQGRGGAALRCI